MSETTLAGERVRTKRERVMRLRIPAALVLIFWTALVAVGLIDKLYFVNFLFSLGSATLFTLLFFLWWVFNRGLRWGQKFAGLAIMISGAMLVRPWMDRSMSPFILWLLGAPVVATVVTLWFKRARRIRAPYVSMAFLLLVYVSWAIFMLLRSEGMDSSLRTAYHWRWTPSAEEKYLAGAPSPKPAKAVEAKSEFAAEKNQWTGFRGANRDGVVIGSAIPTNWTASPTTLWKHAVGPAWSSMTVVGRRLFTQEQRAAMECVVCYDADTGEELWAHEDASRFEEALAGIGPRATPTFDSGRLFTLGGAGILNCLDAQTGKAIWTKDIRKDGHAHPPSWGYSSSPLVVDGKVVVWAGGEKGLLAYSADKGELVWSAPAGTSSYSSAEVSPVDGVEQCLILHDGGLLSVEIATGKKLWQSGYNFPGGPRSNQPKLAGRSDLIVGALDGTGLSSIKVTHSADKWQVATNWISKDMKPEYPDFVVFKDHIYGFDVSMFCCVNMADGKRAWKDGRYGRGQVVLLPDQSLLLIASETGDIVLLAADPAAHRELGKFHAIEGKTWNGPVVNGDRIYHRNGEEMACFSFAEKGKIAAR